MKKISYKLTTIGCAVFCLIIFVPYIQLFRTYSLSEIYTMFTNIGTTIFAIVGIIIGLWIFSSFGTINLSTNKNVFEETVEDVGVGGIGKFLLKLISIAVIAIVLVSLIAGFFKGWALILGL